MVKRKWVEVHASDNPAFETVAKALNRLVPHGVADVQVVFCGRDVAGDGQYLILATVDADAEIATSQA